MNDIIETNIPGRPAIALISYYQKMRDYYPHTELETKRWFVENVHRNWWIFDIGANIGYYSILFAQLAPEGRVLAFEPTSTAAMLRENLSYNRIQNVDVHKVALGARSGNIKDGIFRIWGDAAEIMEYPFYKLDDFVAEHRPLRIDCLKIDVDSFDFDVLRGAEGVLRTWNPFVIVELNHALERRQQSAGEALAWLAGLGYRKALVLDHDNFVLHRDHDANPDAGNERSLQLIFPMPFAVEETIEAVNGSPVPNLFLGDVRLQNGASIKGQPPVTPHVIDSKRRSLFSKGVRRLPMPGWLRSARGTQLASIIDVTIDTSPAAWDYALLLDVDTELTRQMPMGSYVSVEVSVEVGSGKIGIAWLDEDCTTFSSPERFLSAMSRVQQIVISAPAKCARYLVLRNAAHEGTSTSFAVKNIRAMAVH